MKMENVEYVGKIGQQFLSFLKKVENITPVEPFVHTK